MITPEGDYLSNLQAPDLRPYFKHLHWRKMGHSMGHLVASDWADKANDDPVFGLYKNCGLMCRDEAAILFECAQRSPDGKWMDIGSHTGWTSAHIGITGSKVMMVDPMLSIDEFSERASENTYGVGKLLDIPEQFAACGKTSNETFDLLGTIKMKPFYGFCIDGDHQPGAPLQDAQNAYKHLADTGVIIFHDFIGKPVRDGVTWLMDQGMKARVYWTPHLVAVCWRGDFEPPKHEPDPRINWVPHLQQMKRDFDFGRLS